MRQPFIFASLTTRDENARVVMLSVYDGEEDIFRAVAAGAAAYLTKATERDERLAAFTGNSARDRGSAYWRRHRVEFTIDFAQTALPVTLPFAVQGMPNTAWWPQSIA